jgi:hypothetical protein
MALWNMNRGKKKKAPSVKRTPTRKQSIAKSTAKAATARVKAMQAAKDDATIAKGKPTARGIGGVAASSRYASASKRTAGRTPAKKAAAKKAPAKKAAAKKESFKSAFAAARKAQGAGGTFTWNGKKYTTERADDKKKSPGSSAYNKKMMAKSPQGRMRSRMRRNRGGK